MGVQMLKNLDQSLFFTEICQNRLRQYQSNFMKVTLITYRECILFTALLIPSAWLHGQPLEVRNAPPVTPQNLVTNIFLGEGVEVLDVQFQGASGSVGLFQNGDDEIGLSRGIVMSTGYAVSNFGQVGVDSPGATQSNEEPAGPSFDPDMVRLAGIDNINDLVAYTITFIPTADTLRFRYVFASEEYPEYVCSDYNDVFGFFISGPGINGPYSNNAENIALIPGTGLAVAINNVNPGVAGSNGSAINCTPPNGSLSYSQYYNNNNGSPNRPVYDGLTDVFTAEAVVFPCSTYTIRLVICDVFDALFDSGVFLEAKSFGAGSLSVEAATVSLDGAVAEGCAEGQLIFSLPAPAEADHPIDYHIRGAAVNGVDYNFIPPGLFIPAGDSLLVIPVIAFQDNVAEGTENIIIDVRRDPCNRDTLIIPIRENILLEPELRADTLICRGDSLQLDGTVAMPLPQPPTFYSEDTLVISPNNVTFYSDINVAGVLPAALRPGVIRSVCIEDLRTTWVDDLRLYLISPGGQFLELVTDIGNAGDNFIGTCFTPLATVPVTSLTAADQPFTGAFAPEGVWDDLYGDGRPTNGAWRLSLFDKFFADVPVLNRWSVTFTPEYEVKYSWQPAAGLSCTDCPNPMASPDATTAYIVTATDSYGCSSYDTITVGVLPPPDAPRAACAAITDNQITISWPDVPGGLGYEVNVDSSGWLPPNGLNAHTVSGLTLSTTVRFLLRTIGPCGAGSVAEISCATPDCVPPAFQVSSTTDVSCFGGSDGSLNLSAAGGAPPYQFSLGGQSNNSGQFTNLPAGAYTAMIVDDSGCPASLQVTINQPDSLHASPVIDSVSCSGGADGAATLAIAAGRGPFIFRWSNGQADSVATGLAAGSYQLMVTDANACSFSYSLHVGEPDSLSINLLADSALCAGSLNGRAVVMPDGGSGAYTYTFEPGAIIGTTPNQAVGLSAGNYSVTVADSKGCTATAGFAIGEPLPLQGQLAAADALCADSAGAAVSAVVSGGTGRYTYTWRDAFMNIVGAAPEVSGLYPGRYFLEARDENGCRITDSVTAGSPPPLAFTLNVQPASCPGTADGSVGLLAGGGMPPYAFHWSDIGNGPAARTGLPAGSYTVAITDLNGCSLEVRLEVESPPPITLALTTAPTSCPGVADGQATVAPAGGAGAYTYLWEDGQDTPVASGLRPGPISVVVTDGNGCQASGSVVVGEAVPMAVSLEGNGPLCFGQSNGSANAIVQGGAGNYVYLWSNGQTGPAAAGLLSGVHSVTITDGNGCTVEGALELGQPSPLVISISTTAASCNPGPDGAALSSVSGGTPPYSYNWSDGQSQPIAQGLGMGVYTLTVTDANACALADTAVVDGIAPITLSLESRNVSCQGGSDGLAIVMAAGGSGQYAYLWSGGSATGARALNLIAGNYSVTVSDELGCVAVASALIEEPSALLLETAAEAVSCSGDADGSLSLEVSGGTAPYRVLWSTGDTTLRAGGLAVGTYSVTVTDANGCRGAAAAQVVEASPISLSVEIEAVKCFGEASGAISIQVNGGMPPFAYQWSNGFTGPGLQDIPAGEYSLSVTDAAGCEVVEEVVAPQPLAPLDAAISTKSVSCFGRQDGRLEIAASGGTPAYRYSLDGNFFSGNSTFIGLAPGPYTVHIRDAGGCILRAGAVSVGEPAPIVVGLGENRPVDFGTSTRIDAEVSGGSGDYTYEWRPQDSSLLDCFFCSSPNVIVPYQVSFKLAVTDSDGCTGEGIVTLYPKKDRPVFVPTGFTPNGDGSNDRLLVHARDGLEATVLYFRVFDRWGELLFESGGFEPNDETMGWDGAFRGQPVQGGVYIWHVGVEFTDGAREEFTGNTTLIK